jgi:hypothetical protein
MQEKEKPTRDTEESGDNGSERKPTMVINEKGLNNKYLREHLFGKGISPELIKKCLAEGTEMTHTLRQRKKGSRYFMMEVPEGAGMPGRFVLPDINGPLSTEVANWNAKCEYKFRHGRLVPVISRRNIPEWLLEYASTFWVILERNELPDGRLQDLDGPTKDDPEGNWLVATAHFGPPSVPKPQVPKLPKFLQKFIKEETGQQLEKELLLMQNKGEMNAVMEMLTSSVKNSVSSKEQFVAFANELNSFVKELMYYLRYLDNWTREQYNTVYVDLEEEQGEDTEEKEPSPKDRMEEIGTGFFPAKRAEDVSDTDYLKKIAMAQQNQIEEMREEIKRIRKEIKNKSGEDNS